MYHMAFSSTIEIESDRFLKCHSQFTGEVLDSDDANLVLVKNGSINGVEACRRLLSQASLINGELQTQNSNSYEVGKKVLASFLTLGNSLFETVASKDFADSPLSRYVYDINDRSYYLLLAMFSANSSGASDYNFKKIFTDSVTYRAKRENSSNSGHFIHRVQVFGASNLDAPVIPYPMCGERNSWSTCSSFENNYATLSNEVFAVSGVDVSSGFLVPTMPTQKIRENEELFDISLYGHNGINDFFGQYDNNRLDFSSNDIAHTGELVGVVPKESFSIPSVFMQRINDSDGYYRNYLGPAFMQPYPFPINNIHDNLSAGLLFTPNSQQSMQVDEENIFVQNGLEKVPRRWSEGFFKDFLCRDIPVIRVQDAAVHVEAVPNQIVGFRNSASCMRCHASMDNLAYIGRNYRLKRASPRGGESVYINQFLHPTFPQETSVPSTPDKFFVVRPASGQFRFRDLYGNYHDVQLSSNTNEPKKAFKELGEYLANNLDDSYACLVSKYFTHFTGLEVSFFDPGDPDAPQLDSRQLAIQNYIVNLGKRLKTDGRLKDIILDIVSSDLYINPKRGQIPQ